MKTSLSAPGNETRINFVDSSGSIQGRIYHDFDDDEMYFDLADGFNFAVGAGNFVLNSTTGALIVPRMTLAQRSAITGVNGMIVYDTNFNRFYGYQGGAWALL